MQYDYSMRLRWLLHLIANGTAIDMEEYLKPEFDLSMLDEYDLREFSIEEIIEVYMAGRTAAKRTVSPLRMNQYALVGFTKKSRCLSILLDFENDTPRIQLVRAAEIYEIERFWCNK